MCVLLISATLNLSCSSATDVMHLNDDNDNVYLSTVEPR